MSGWMIFFKGRRPWGRVILDMRMQGKHGIGAIRSEQIIGAAFMLSLLFPKKFLDWDVLELSVLKRTRLRKWSAPRVYGPYALMNGARTGISKDDSKEGVDRSSNSTRLRCVSCHRVWKPRSLATVLGRCQVVERWIWCDDFLPYLLEKNLGCCFEPENSFQMSFDIIPTSKTKYYRYCGCSSTEPLTFIRANRCNCSNWEKPNK